MIMSPPPMDQTPTGLLLLNILNTITHFVIGSVTVVVVIFGYNSGASDHFRQHIILCTLGYLLLMCEAILAFNKSNGWSHSLHHKQRGAAHLYMQIAGSSLAIAGSIIRIQGYGGQKFGTPHGILGWLAFLLTCLTLFGGLLNLILKQRGKVFKIGHPVMGILTIVFALICLTLGLDKISFRNSHTDGTANVMITFTCVALVGTLSSACPNLFTRIF